MEFAKRYFPPVFCPHLSLLPKTNVGSLLCGSEGEPGCPRLSQVATIVGGMKAGLILH